ncbi:unnamed protein product, partial [Didymodactylos carnosus]
MYRFSSDRPNIAIKQSKKTMSDSASTTSTSQDFDFKLSEMVKNILNNPSFIQIIVSQVKEHFKNELIEVTQTLEDHQAQIDDITMRHNDLEQYDRRLNILVYGVPEDKNENTTDTILDMCQSINVNIKQSDISTSHRLGKP